MDTYLVDTLDIDSCVDFVELVKDDFAGYVKEDFIKSLKQCIEQKSAFMTKDETKVTGLILFSYQEKELQFLATLPTHRKQGIAYTLIHQMMNCFEKGDIIHVITFREGDKKGLAARACYHAVGFVDDELLEIFHYPCQKMIYTVS